MCGKGYQRDQFMLHLHFLFVRLKTKRALKKKKKKQKKANVIASLSLLDPTCILLLMKIFYHCWVVMLV